RCKGIKKERCARHIAHLSPNQLSSASLSQLLGLFLFDTDLLGFASLAIRNRDRQHPILIAGVDLISIDWLIKRNASSEEPERISLTTQFSFFSSLVEECCPLSVREFCRTVNSISSGLTPGNWTFTW